MEDFDDNAFATHSHVERDAHVSTRSLESIEAYQHGVEAIWSIIAQLREAAELVIQEAWQHRYCHEWRRRVTVRWTLDHLWTTPPSTGSHEKMELCSLNCLEALAIVLQAGIKVKRYIYVDVDDVG
jgi:hypothetical protein